MNKTGKKQIHCLTNNKGTPIRVELQERMQRVSEVMENWADTGQWWKGESEKMFYRLQLETGPVIEIYKDLSSGEWWKYKVYD